MMVEIRSQLVTEGDILTDLRPDWRITYIPNVPTNPINAYKAWYSVNAGIFSS